MREDSCMSTRVATTTGAVSRALREAIVTMLATVATLFCAMEIDPEPAPAVLAVVLCLSFARRLHILPPLRQPVAQTAAPAPESSMRPVASTRMAIQMAVGLTASFLIGHVFFAEHWEWIVLTAFIVNSGNRGRLDVAYKSA